MPFYCFTTPSGKTVERRFSMADVPASVEVDGERALRDYRAEWAGRRDPGDLWPIYSDGLGVHPSQVKQVEAESKAAGIPTHFTKDGRAVLESRSHRRRYLRYRGFIDRDGYC